MNTLLEYGRKLFHLDYCGNQAEPQSRLQNIEHPLGLGHLLTVEFIGVPFKMNI
jgi:hypothetical protein